MDSLKLLQEWYLSQCDEDWEHSFGVKIDTLDNPGWKLVIDLDETELDGKEFSPVEKNYESENNWLTCIVEDNKFTGFCGPLLLSEMVKVFIEWANDI